MLTAWQAQLANVVCFHVSDVETFKFTTGLSHLLHQNHCTDMATSRTLHSPVGPASTSHQGRLILLGSCMVNLDAFHSIGFGHATDGQTSALRLLSKYELMMTINGDGDSDGDHHCY